MRNGLKRTIAGSAFVALVVLCVLHPCSFILLTLAVTVVLLHEFYAMTIGMGDTLLRCMGLLTAAVTFVLVSLAAASWISPGYVSLSILCFTGIVVCTVLKLRNGELEDISKVAYVFAGLLYVGLPMVLSSLIGFHGGEFNGLPLICFFAIIWCSDVGAYLVGSALGQKPGSRKLCPAISPKKSWAGFWGGMLGGVVGALILHFTGLLGIGLPHAVAFALVISVAGVFGDLFESIWKRVCGVKDSGFIIPGHGGMLDRFDSTLVAMPVAYVYLVLFDLL